MAIYTIIIVDPVLSLTETATLPVIVLQCCYKCCNYILSVSFLAPFVASVQLVVTFSFTFIVVLVKDTWTLAYAFEELVPTAVLADSTWRFVFIFSSETKRSQRCHYNQHNDLKHMTLMDT